MSKTKKTLAMTLGLLLTMSTAFASVTTSPELPARHWAYDAVTYLAKAGIIASYTPSNKTMTRAAMAEIVSNAIKNEEKATPIQRTLIDKLGIEFALEMNHIDSHAEAVASNKSNATQEASKIRFSGLVQETYKMNVDKTGTQSYGQEKVQLGVTAKFDENNSATVRLATPTPTSTNFRDTTTEKFGQFDTSLIAFDRLYETTKFGIVDLNIGRQGLSIDPDNIIVDSEFFNFDGLNLKWTNDGYNFDVKRGRFAQGLAQYTSAINSAGTAYTFSTDVNTGVPFNGLSAQYYLNVDIDEIMLSKAFGKAQVNLGWARFWNPVYNVTLMEYNIGRIAYLFNDHFSVASEWASNREAINGGRYVTMSAVLGDQNPNTKGQQNISVQYAHVGKNTIYNNYSSSSFASPGAKFTGDAFDNIVWDYRYAFSPNIGIKFEYWNVWDKDHNVNQATYHYEKVVLAYKF